MEELVYIKKNDAFTDSMVIAEATGNQHNSVMRLIKRQRESLEKFGVIEFMDLKSKNHKGGRPIKICPLNEMQATLLITFLDNSDSVVDFKTELVRQFYEMRKILAQRQTEVWIDTRSQGKMIRKEETDMIQKLIQYAKEQGSEHSDMLYITYSRLANKMAGIKNRDEADVRKLNLLLMIENIIKNVIDRGMEADRGYKEIYKDCKTALEQFLEAAYLSVGGAALCQN